MPNFLDITIEILTFGIVLSLILFCPVWAPGLVYLDLAIHPGASTPGRPRLYLIDLFVGTFQLAAVNALLMLMRRELSGPQFTFLQVVSNCFVALVWLGCLKFMYHRGITTPQHRLLVQAVYYPLSIVAVGEFLCSIFFLFIGAYRWPESIVVPIILATVAWSVLYYLRKTFSQLIISKATNAQRVH